jgi:hypothetical protein
MSSAKWKIRILTTLTVIAMITLVIQQRKLREERDQNERDRAHNAISKAETVSEPQPTMTTAIPTNSVLIASTELAHFEKDRISLLRLRNEANMLRRQLAEFKVGQDANAVQQTESHSPTTSALTEIVTNDTPIEVYDHILKSGAFSYNNVTVSQILPNLPGLSGATVEVGKGVLGSSSLITFSAPAGTTRAEAARLLEQVLREQAGLIVTHADATHISVNLK